MQSTNNSIVKHRDVVRRLNLNLLHKTNKFISSFTGTNVIIAGGYCSDLVHGVTPKDCDVWIKCDLKQYGHDSEGLTRDLRYTLVAAGLKGDFTFNYVNYSEAKEVEPEHLHHNPTPIAGYLKTVVVYVKSRKNGVDLDMDFIFLDHSHFDDNDIGSFSTLVTSNFDMDITRMYLHDWDNYRNIQVTPKAILACKQGSVSVYADRDNRFFCQNNSTRVRNSRIERYKDKYKAFNYQYKIVE